MKQNIQYKKGLLESLALWCPIWFPYTIGIFTSTILLPAKYGYLRYRKFCHFLKKSQWWSRERLENYQTERLKLLLEYVYKNVPYYKEIFKRRKLTPDDFNSVKDLEKFPLLTKEDVINNFDKLIAKNFSFKQQKKRFMLKYTSGSMGKPMPFYLDKKYEFMKIAFMQWRNNLANIKISHRRIQLWSRPFIERKIKDIKLYGPYQRMLSLSTVPHTMDKLEEYLRLIKGFKSIYVRGSPSFLYQLAQYAQEVGDDSVKFRVFLSVYENLYPFQRELIQKQFHCEIFNYYALEENLVYAIECNKHEGMHLDIRKGVMEIVGEDGEVLDNGHHGRIICTGFDNYVMPLIRYDIGDIGSVSNRQCSCGRGLPLLKSLDGRTSEIIKYNGKTIYPATLSLIFERLRNIKECQFVQDKEDEIKINIVKRKTYSSKDTEELIKSLKFLIGKDFNAEIYFVDNIPRTKMGKFQFVVNRLAQY